MPKATQQSQDCNSGSLTLESMFLITNYSRRSEEAGWKKRRTYTWPSALGAAGSQAAPNDLGGCGKERPGSHSRQGLLGKASLQGP